MRSFVLILLALFGLAIPTTAPADDIEGPDGVVLSLTAGSVIFSGANLMAMTLYDGSTGLGILNTVVGGALAVYAPITDSVADGDERAFVAVGLGAAFIGICDILMARGNDPELLGMRVGPASGRLAGLQIVARW